MGLTQVVLLGGGHAHALALLDLKRRPIPGATVVLVSKHRTTPYSGALPALVSGALGFEDAHIDLERLCARTGMRFVTAEAVGIDPEARTVRLADGGAIPFDLLSIDIGSTPNTADVPGAAEHAIPVKPIDGFLRRLEAVERSLAPGSEVAVVGGGVGGVELSLALDRRFRDVGRPMRLAVVAAGPRLMPEQPARGARLSERALAMRSIAVAAGFRVAKVDRDGLHGADGRTLAAATVFWCTQAAPAPWLRRTGLALDRGGFVLVDHALRSTSHAGVFAAGDVAAVAGHALPKAGVVAVRQAPVLAENLRRAAAGHPLLPYRPQRDWLTVMGTADARAIAMRGGIAAEGAWAWRWKRWLDRRFLRRFR